MQNVTFKFTHNCIRSYHIILYKWWPYCGNIATTNIKPDNVILIKYKSIEQFHFICSISYLIINERIDRTISNTWCSIFIVRHVSLPPSPSFPSWEIDESEFSRDNGLKRSTLRIILATTTYVLVQIINQHFIWLMILIRLAVELYLQIDGWSMYIRTFVVCVQKFHLHLCSIRGSTHWILWRNKTQQIE